MEAEIGGENKKILRPAQHIRCGAQYFFVVNHQFDYNYENKGTYSQGTYAPGDTVTFPSDPNRDNYNFLGWYTASSGGYKITM